MVEYGGDIMLFVGSGATEKAIAYSTSAKLNVTMSTRETTSKDSGNWTEKMAGKFTWNVSTDALLNYSTTGTTVTNSITELFTIYKNREPITMSFAAKSGTTPAWTKSTTKKYFTGKVLITSFDINAGDGDNATYTLSGDGTGELNLV